MNEMEKKPKDYKKISRVKTVIFLVLAVLVLVGMYLKENPGKKRTGDGMAERIQTIETCEANTELKNGDSK